MTTHELEQENSTLRKAVSDYQDLMELAAEEIITLKRELEAKEGGSN